jgi:cytoskeletal protein CcmA (bactofilin family)
MIKRAVLSCWERYNFVKSKQNDMFNSKSKSFEESSASGNSLIGGGTTIQGNIDSNGDIRIDGVLKGNLSGKGKILIGPEGAVEGDIEGEQADVLGKITGKIKVAGLLNLRGKAFVQGDIYAGKLQVEPTVTFNGQCHMGANVVDIKNELSAAVNL